MLVVRVELWPGGSEKRAKEIGRTYIANVGGTIDRGDYCAAVCRKWSTDVPADIFEASGLLDRAEKCPRAVRTGKVEDYPRLTYSVWRLVIRTLRSCFPEEK